MRLTSQQVTKNTELPLSIQVLLSPQNWALPLPVSCAITKACHLPSLPCFSSLVHSTPWRSLRLPIADSLGLKPASPSS